MTREEAILVLERCQYDLSNQLGSDWCKKKYEAVTSAIEAIKQQKTGHWIEKTVVIDEFTDDEETFYVCDCCNEEACQPHKHCPNCGAKMEGRKHE